MSTAVTTPLPRTAHTVLAASRRRRLDWFEAALLTAFACISMWVVGLDLWRAAGHHLVWTGTDGLFLGDQMQYLAWIQDASKHALVSDLFVTRATPHDYFQPEIVISGAIARLGVAPWLTLLLWKPVAVLSAFLAIRAYCHRLLPDRFDRSAALALALFFGSFGALGDEWLPFWSWGYSFGLIAIAALAGALISYDRARSEARLTWVAPVLGLIASFSHPWQGELLILIVVGAEALGWRSGRRKQWILLPAVTVAATALPLLYFELLDRTDSVWQMAQLASRHHYALSLLLVPLLPLLVASAPAYWRWPAGFLETATRLWPFATLAIYGFSSTGLAGTPLHAFGGITIPLAVLAVEGVRRVGLRRLVGWRFVAAALVVAATVPATVHELRTDQWFVQPARGNANLIPQDEDRALHYLRVDRERGAVLTRGYLGVIVPARTGRHTYAGDCLWSEPNCTKRQSNVWDLFRGGFTPTAARAFVRSTHARFLLKDCYARVNLMRTVGPLIRSVRHFGCASVYELK